MTKTQHAATETNNKMQQAIHTTSTVQAYPEVQQAQNSCEMQAGQMGNTATLLQHQEMQKRQQDLQRQQEEVQKQDNCIRQLQKQLKDAETLLSTAIYQANQKLDSIKKAKENPVSSEELIKYAHRISASNAVSAPLNWQQG